MCDNLNSNFCNIISCGYAQNQFVLAQLLDKNKWQIGLFHK